MVFWFSLVWCLLGNSIEFNSFKIFDRPTILEFVSFLVFSCFATLLHWKSMILLLEMFIKSSTWPLYFSSSLVFLTIWWWEWEQRNCVLKDPGVLIQLLLLPSQTQKHLRCPLLESKIMRWCQSIQTTITTLLESILGK